MASATGFLLVGGLDALGSHVMPRTQNIAHPRLFGRRSPRFPRQSTSLRLAAVFLGSSPVSGVAEREG